MATTKTLTPTNQAITLADFTEKPDNRTNVTNDDKLGDAVNALNSNFSTLLTPTNVSANVTIASGGYVKIGTIVIVNVHINVDQAVTGNDTICTFPAPRVGNQAVLPMAPSSSGIGSGKVMYIRENGEARFFQGEAAGTSYNISGAYIARS